jgi:hypothetical protein
MINHTNIFDSAIKRIVSIIYRLILISLSLYIVFKEEGVLNIYLYVFLSFFYLFIYLKINKRINGIIRLILDYFFIIIILFDRELFTFPSIVLFLLPFINSPNHTSKYKNIFVLFLISFLSFSVLYINNFKYEQNIGVFVDIFVCLLIISILIYLEYLRSLFIKEILEGYKKIDNIDFDKSRASNIPNIYSKIIEVLNNELLEKYYIRSKINFITCISLDKEELNILNSSKFIFNIKLDNASIQKLYQLDKDNSILYNLKFKVNENNEENKNIVFNINYKKKRYYFILFFNMNFSKPNFLIRIIIGDYLKPLFKKILLTISLEEHIRITKSNNMKKILSEMKYVSTTNKSLHTLNNQFTPIKTYFTMLNDYENDNNTLDKVVLGQMLKKQKVTAENAFKRIVTQSEYLLNKNLNPFAIKNLNNIKLKVLYMILKPIWMEEFSDKYISFNLNERNLDEVVIYSNIDLFEILFIDIVQNMKKYSKKNSRVNFVYENGIILIIFENEVILSPKDRKALIKDIQLFNDDDKLQLLLKKGHGFSNIKEIITNLGISCTISLKENIFETQIIIKEKEKKI